MSDSDSQIGRMSNFGRRAKSSLRDIYGGINFDVYDRLEKLTVTTVNSLRSAYEYMYPCYKVMITVPAYTKTGTFKPYRYIIADTSRLQFKKNPVVGIWVDESDKAEPDKAIVLLEDELVLDGDNLVGADVTDFNKFGTRNWLDIWLGYKQDVNKSMIEYLKEKKEKEGKWGVLLGSINAVTTGLLSKIAWTYPDPFVFGNDSHVFSGPIVSIRRILGQSGDRIQIIGFSPIMMFKSIEAEVNYPIGKSIEQVIKKTIEEKCVSFYEFGFSKNGEFIPSKSPVVYDDVTGDDPSKPREMEKDKFYLGLMPCYMWTGSPVIGNVGAANIGKIYPRVIPLSNPYLTGKDNWATQTGVVSVFDNDPVDISEKIAGKTVGTELKQPIGKLREPIKGKMSLYDLFFNRLTDPIVTGLQGLHVGIFRNPPYSRRNYNYSIEWAFSDGYGHPGISLRYTYEYQIDGIVDAVKNKRYSDQYLQVAKLGIDVKEMDVGVESSSTFNAREFMTKEYTQPKEVDRSVPLTRTRLFPFHNDYIKKIPTLTAKDIKKFINALTTDIYIYGYSKMPTASFLFTKKPITTDADLFKALMDHMRSTYYAGMSGTVFSIGNPGFKPLRVVKIEDHRGQPSQRISSDIIAETRRTVMKQLGFEEPNTVSPDGMLLRQADKYYYIWKTRHYFGKNSGYVTKLYIIEERSNLWKQMTPSIENIMRAAFANSKDMINRM